jgi:hypothetical protein
VSSSFLANYRARDRIDRSARTRRSPRDAYLGGMRADPGCKRLPARPVGSWKGAYTGLRRRFRSRVPLSSRTTARSALARGAVRVMREGTRERCERSISTVRRPQSTDRGPVEGYLPPFRSPRRLPPRLLQVMCAAPMVELTWQLWRFTEFYLGTVKRRQALRSQS